MPKIVPVPLELQDASFHVSVGGAFGLTEPALRSRSYQRPFCGVRSTARVETLHAMCEAYLTRMRAGQCFSHTTAARLWGIPLPAVLESQRDIHVSSIDGTRPRLRGVVGHELHGDRVRVVDRGGLPVADPATTWLHMATIVAFDDLVAAADHLIHVPRRPDRENSRPHLLSSELVARAGSSRGRGSRLARTAVEWMRVGAESRRETMLRLALIRAGLPEPELNKEILCGSKQYFGDLVYPRWKVLVEYDGEQHRTDTKQYRHDIERHDALTREGWLVIREGLHTPPAGPRSTPSLTRQALHSRGWRRETSIFTLPGAFWRGK